MSRKLFTKKFLISEINRFAYENDRIPKQEEMLPKFGFPQYGTYHNYFGSWNNALEEAGYKPNRIQHRPKLDGTETCAYCGKRADEIPNFTNWLYDKDRVRYCKKHYYGKQDGSPHYTKGELDINSNVGRGRSGELLLANVLNINKKYDCNRISCGYKFDLYHEKYGKIDVKTSVLNCDYNTWVFMFYAKKEADTYICVGLSDDTKRVEHLWIVPNEGEIRNTSGITIKNTSYSLYNRKRWEVDAKPYNDMWQTMKLDNCKIMVDKSKNNYIDPTKQSSVVSNTIKQAKKELDKNQFTLDEF